MKTVGLGFFVALALLCVSLFHIGPFNPGHTAYAATGIFHQINFQGKLVNPDGTNVTDGTYSVVFSLYTVSSAGSNIWTETQSVTTAAGIFQINLGSVTTLPGSVDFNTDNLYLGIKVGADAEMTPRIQFTAVPQAFNSEKLGGLLSSAFGQLATTNTWANTNTFQPTTNVTSVKILQNSSGSFAQDVFDVQGSSGGANNFIQVTSTAANQGAVTIASLGANNLNLNSGSNTISVGSTAITGTGALTISSAAATILDLESGTTANVNLGISANNKTVNIGAVGSTTNTTTVNIANSSAAGQAQTVNIGSTANAASTLVLNAGTTGGIAINGLVATSSPTALCLSGGKLSNCTGGTGASGTPFVQNGNAFGAVAVLGTTDAFDLQIITGTSGPNGRAYFDQSNNLFLGNGTGNNTGTNAAPTAIFSILGTTSTSLAGVAPGSGLTIKGGKGTATGTGSAGGSIILQGGDAQGTGPDNGGGLTLDSGAKVGAGTSTISFGTTNATAINVGSATVGLTLASTTGTGIAGTTLTSGTGLNFGGASTTTGTGLLFNTTSLTNTTASALSVTGTANGAISAYTGNLINVSPSRTNTATAGTITDSGSLLNLSRTEAQNGAGGTLSVTGTLANLQSNCTQTAGTCTDSGKILNLNQQYASATGTVLNIQNAGTGTSLQITPTGNTSASTSVGGAINLNNTSNTGAGLVVYSNQATPAGRLVVIRADNAGFNQNALYVESGGTAAALAVVQTDVADGGTGGQGVSITSDSGGGSANVHGLTVNLTGTGNANASAGNFVSANAAMSAVQISGQETGRGSLKISHTGTGGDTNASALSLDLAGSGTAAQGIFLDATGGGTTGKLLNLRNNGTEYLTLNASGQLGLGVGGTPTALLNTMGNSAALLLQTTTGANVLNVDTSVNANLITNGDFESNLNSGTGGWTGTNATLAQSNAQQWQGNNAMSVSYTSANGTAAYTYNALAQNTQYTFSFYGRPFAGSTSTINIGHTYNGTSTDDCTGQTLTSSIWMRLTCTFTTANIATTNNANVYIKDTVTAQTIYIDGAELQTGASATAFNAGGAIQLSGLVNSPLAVQNKSDSANAFQIQNAAGTSNLLVADTLNTKLGIAAAPSATGATLQVGGDVSINTLDAVTVNSASVCRDTSTKLMTACDATNTTGRPFLQSGNTFGAPAVLGTNDSNSLSFITNTATQATIAVGGATTFKNSANSTTAFQVQNAAAAPIFLVDTTSTDSAGNTVNYLTYPGFESGAFNNAAAGWNLVASATLAQNSNKQHAYNGLFSAQLGTTGSGDGMTTTSFASVPAANTYIVSFYAKLTVGTSMTGANFTVATTGGVASCNPSAGITLATTTVGFQRLSCSLAPGSNVTGLTITQNVAGAKTIYIDAVQLQTNDFAGGTNNIAAPTAYQIGTIQLRGVISNPVTLMGNSNSTTALQVQDATANSLLGVDTLNDIVNLGSTGAQALASTVNIGTSTGIAQTVLIGSNANFASTTTIQGGNGTAAIALTPQTTGTIVIGAAGGSGNITLGSSTGTQTVLIGDGTGATGISNVNIANSATVGATVNIATAANTAADALNIMTGNNSATDTINIGTGATTVANGKTINIGNGTPSGSGTNIISIGSIAALANTTTIQGGNGATAVSVQAAAGGTISIGTANNNPVNIGTGAVAGLITIGGTGTTGNITLGQSNSTNSVLIGSGTGATTVSIANTAASATGNTVNINGSATATGLTDTVNIATGNTVGTGAKVVHIADGNPAGTNTVTIGSITATANVTNIQGGNGATAVNVQAAASGTINIATANNNNVTIGSAQVAGLIAIGGTAGTGNITLGSSTAGQSVLIANGSGAPTVSIANASVSGVTLNIAGANNTSANLINIANGLSAANSTVNILSGVGTAGAGDIHIGNNTRVNVIDIGNIAAAATRTLNIGTGSNIVGVDTINLGTGATTVANGKTINIGNGTPSGSGTNIISIGSIAALANTTTIQGGNGAGAISIQAATNGTISVGTSNVNTVNIGNATGAAALSLQAGSGGIAVSGLVAASSPVALCLTSGKLSNCAGTTGTTGTPFVQGGNSFGGQANLGTTDANKLGIGTFDGTALHTRILIDKTASTSANAALTFTGTDIFKPETGQDSTTAFQIQNAAGNSVFNADTSTTSNLIVGGDFENTFPGAWAGTNATLTQVSAQQEQGGNSMQVVITAANGTATYTYNALAQNTQYTFSFYAKPNGGTISTINVGHTYNGASTDDCTGQTITSGIWTRVTCTFTTANVATTNNANVYIKDTTNSQTFWVDGAQLVTGSLPKAFNAGASLQISGVLNSPLFIQPKSDSPTLFDVQGSTGSELLVADSAHFNVMVGNSTTNAQLQVYGSQYVRSNTGDNYIQIQGGATNAGYLRFNDAGQYLALSVGAETNNNFKIDSNGNSSFKPTADSTTAFQIQNALGTTNLLTADTTNLKVQTVGDVNVGSRYGNRLFSDNFESGGFGLWSGGSSGNIAIDSTTPHDGKYDAKVTATGSVSQATTTLATSSTVYARMWVNVSSGTNFDLLAVSGTNAGATLYYDATMHLCVWNNTLGASAGCSAGTVATGAYHMVELRTTNGNPTGTLQAYLDGTQVVNATGINNGAGTYNFLWTGEVNGGHTATYFMDDLAIDTIDAGTASSLNVDDSLHVGGTSTFGNSVLIQPASNSSTAFQVQNAAGTQLLNADTTTLHLTAGNSTIATAVAGGSADSHGVNQTTLATLTTHTVGNLVTLAISSANSSDTVNNVSGGGVNNWKLVNTNTDVTTPSRVEIWEGTVATTGTNTITVNFNATLGAVREIAGQEFTAGLGSSTNWSVAASGGVSNASSGSITYPSLTATQAGQLYWGYGYTTTTGSAGATSGFTYAVTGGLKVTAYNNNLVAGTPYTPTATTTASRTDAVGMIIGASVGNTLTVNNGLTVSNVVDSGVVGPNQLNQLPPNNNFNNVTYWTNCNASGWTGTATTATHAAAGGTTACATTASDNAAVLGTLYQVSFTVTGSPTSTESVTPYIGGIAGTPIYGNDATEVQQIYVSFGGGTTAGVKFVPTNNWNGIISNVSVQQVTSSTAALKVLDSTGIVALEVRTGNASLNNTGVGLASLLSNTTGNDNSALGSAALESNTTGYNNSAVGVFALYGNTTGWGNSAVGLSALGANTVGTQNTAVGMQTLANNTTGQLNSALGYQALVANTNGSNNTAIGTYALTTNTTGIDNTALGEYALQFNTIGGHGVALGFNALYTNTTGGYNIGIGDYAGVTTVTGNGNISGIGNTFVGAEAGPGSTIQLQNASAFGVNSVVNASNTLILGCTGAVNACSGTTNVGIASNGYANNPLTVSAGTYSTGTIRQDNGTPCTVGNTVTGVGTTFTTAMVGGTLYYSDGSNNTITGFTSATVLTVGGAAKCVAAGATYTIVYGGFNATSTGSVTLQNASSATAAYLQEFGATTANAPAVSPTGTGRIYFDTTSNTFKISSNGGAYANILSAATDFIQGGNSFGAQAVLGTTDANSLKIGTFDTSVLHQRILITNTASTTANAALTFTGTSIFKPETGQDSTTAFQIQNAVGAQLLNVDTSTTPNLTSNNPSFEVADISAWLKRVGTETLTQTATQAYQGNDSLQVLTAATASSGVKYSVGLNATTTYAFSAYVKTQTGTVGTFQIGRAEDGATDTSCATAQTANSTSWTRITCTFTTSDTTPTTPYVYIKQTDATARTFFVDAVQLEAKTNLLTNPGVEVAIAGNWTLLSSGTGTSTVAQDATAGHFSSGTKGLKIQPSVTGTGVGAKENVVLASNTTYTFSAYVKDATAQVNTIELGRAEDGATNTACITAQTIITTGFIQLTCTFTTGIVSGTTYVYIRDTASRLTTSAYYVDQFQLFTGSNTGPSSFQLGAIALNGTINSPVAIKNQADSNSAFQVQNADGTSLLAADTKNMRVSIGSIGTSSEQLYVSGTIPSAAIGSVSTSALPWGMYVAGNYAYTVTNGTSFQIINVGKPTAPAIVSTTAVAGATTLSTVVVQGHYAYIDDTGVAKMYIYDITNPATPVLVSTTTTATATNGDMVISGRYLYVYDGTGLQPIDVSNPALPVALTNFTGGGTLGNGNISIKGNLAFVTDNATTKFHVLNISDPTNISVVGISTNASNYYLYVQGNYAYTLDASQHTLQIYDITNPASIANPISSVNTGTSTAAAVTSKTNELFVQGHYAYFSSGDGNIYVTDVSNPTTPTIVNHFNAGTQPQALFVQGNYLYSVDYPNHLLNIFDVGGSYIQQLSTGGLETGTLAVDANATIDGALSVNGGLGVNGGAQVNGNLGVSGTVNFASVTNFATAFQVQNVAGAALLGVDTLGSQVNVSASDLTLNGTQTLTTGPATNTPTAGANTGGTLSGAAGTTYYYKVTAIVNGYETAASPEGSINGQTFTKVTAPVAPTLTPAAGVGFLGTGVYKYKLTYTTANGETTGGTEGTVTTTAPNSKVTISGAAVTCPTGGTTYKIYRTLLAGLTNTERFVSTGTCGSSYTDQTGDAYMLNGTLVSSIASNTATTNLNNATITFGAVGGATGYRVYRGTTSGLENAYQATGSSPFTDTGAAGTANYVPSTGVGLGIGTTSPSASLDVRGNALFMNSSNSTSAFQVQNATATSLLTADTTNMKLYIGSSTSPVFTGDVTNSRVIIGTGGTATSQLYVAGSQPSAVLSTITESAAQDSIVNGRYLYVSNFNGSTLNVFDVSNPAAPSASLGSLALTGNVQAITISGHYIYGADNSTNKLDVIDISKPSAPVLVNGSGTATTPNGPISIAVSGRYVYVGINQGQGIDVFDVSNPAVPVKIASGVAPGYSANALFSAGRYIYEASANDGTHAYLKVIDTTTNTIVGSFPLSGGANASVTCNQNLGARDVYVSGRYAYIGNCGNSAIDIFDVSNPAANSAPVNSINTAIIGAGYGALSLSVQGRYLYAGLTGNGSGPSYMATYDISVPAAAGQVGTAVNVGNSSCIVSQSINGRYMYANDWCGGHVYVLDLGGEYAQALEGGSVEAGTLQVSSDANVAGNTNLYGGLTVGQSTQIGGSLGVSGSAIFANTTNSTTAFQIQNAAGTALFNTDTSTSQITLNTNTTINDVSTSAFPTTSVLDNFNRAGPALGANWTAPAFGDAGTAVITGSTQMTGGAGGDSDTLWTAQKFGPDQEVYADVPTMTATFNEVLLARITGSTTNGLWTGYWLEATAGGTWAIHRNDSGAGGGDNIIATTGHGMNSGDSFGLSAIGSTITAWYKPSGGSWTQVESATDSSYDNAGYIGMDPTTTTSRIDNFGGGTVDALKVYGSQLIQTSTNTTNAFRIQNASQTSLLSADTSNMQISIGNSAKITVVGGGEWDNSGLNLGTLTLSGSGPHTVGNVMILGISDGNSATPVTSVSGGGVTNWHLVKAQVDASADDIEVWEGTVTTTGASTITVTYSGVPGFSVGLAAHEFTAGLGSNTSWKINTGDSLVNASSATVTFPSLTTNESGGLYWGYAFVGTTGSAPSPTAGFTYVIAANGDVITYNNDVVSGNRYAPTAVSSPAGVSTGISMIISASVGNALTVNGSAAIYGNDSDAGVSGELMASTTNFTAGWTCTNWTACHNGGETHSTGNTSALTTTATFAANTTYQVTYAFTSGTNTGNGTDTITPSIGSSFGQQPVYDTDTSNNANGFDSQLITTDGSGGALKFTPSTNWDGTITSVSIKKVYANTSPSLTVTNGSSSNQNQLQVRLPSTGVSEFVGWDSGMNQTTGNWNTGFGFGALQMTTTGGGNTAIGDFALQYNVSGNENVAVGDGDLQSNTSGINNTAIGSNSLVNTNTASGNTAVGSNVLRYGVTGSDNTGVGSGALQVNTGWDNVAVGVDALLANTASNNTAVGTFSLYNNTTGDSLVALGNGALDQNTIGYDSVALGSGALYHNTTGNDNVAIGLGAGESNNAALYANTTGSDNLFIGEISGPGVVSAASLQNAGAIGFGSVVYKNDTINLGCTNGVNLCTATTGISMAAGSYGTADTVNGSATTIQQTLFAITGSGTTFTAGMTGGTIYYSDGTNATVTYVSATSLTSSVSKTVTAGSSYMIVWGGVNVSGTGALTLQNTADSTTAFQIQNASSVTLFTADTTNMVITVSGNTTTFASLTLTNAHFKSTQTTAPTAGTPTACGTTPTGAVTAGSTDSAGSFTLTSGTTTTTATCQIVITFKKAFGAAPKSVVVTGASTNASKMTPAVTATGTTTFTVVLPQTDVVSTAYKFYYWIVE